MDLPFHIGTTALQVINLPLFSSVPTEPVNATLARSIGFPTKLYIQWEPPEEPNGIILAYTVYCKQVMATDGEESFVATPDAIVAVTNGTQSAIHVDDLTPFTTYGCYITANTSVGEGESSIILRATTDESSKITWLSKVVYCFPYGS